MQAKYPYLVRADSGSAYFFLFTDYYFQICRAQHAFTVENAGKDLAPPAAAPSVADPIDVTDRIVIDRSFDVHEAFAHLKKVDKKLNKLITSTDIEEFIRRRVQQTDSSNPFR